MSVFKRQTSAGETKEFHYRFSKNSKTYHGVCHGCLDRQEALAYEAKIKDTVNELMTQRSVKAIVENFRDELLAGEKIAISNAFQIAIDKPKRRNVSPRERKAKQARNSDFVKFIATIYPNIKYLNQVTQAHAECYINYLRTNGKFDKSVEYTNKGKKFTYQANYVYLSADTINRYHKELITLFSTLQKDAGIIDNPFKDIPLLAKDKDDSKREAFTEEELERILTHAPEFVKSIFVVGLFTALREGDIATLRWSDILWEHGIIRRKLLKTHVVVEIPILPPLADFLQAQLGNDSEYVLPEHAKMYLENQSGISYRVKEFLEKDLGIVTTKMLPNRSRATSIKDVHSLRHTFCYLAGVAGIPLVVVQSIVGHMSPEMTNHYTAHSDRKTKKEKLASLPFFNKMIEKQVYDSPLTPDQLRLEIIKELGNADDITLQKVYELVKKRY